MKKYIQFPILALCAFAGSFTAQTMMTATPAQAAAQLMSYFKLSDPANQKGIEMYVNQGAPAQNFYAYDGLIRLQLGTYTAPGERNLPLVSLNDNSGGIRMLLRLAGPNEAPVLIFKDKQHRDRMVMGLSLNGDEVPFITTYDNKGVKTNVLGNF